MKKRKALKIILLIISILFIWILITNITIVTSKYELEFTNLPKDFNGYKIAQISDFHNRNNYTQIVNKLKKENPDIIIITGDLIDSYKTNVDTSINFIKEIIDISPIYYIPGNHEARLDKEYKELKEELTNLNVTILENTQISIVKGESTINILGVVDPTFLNSRNDIKVMKEMLDDLEIDDKTFNILLSHRPELLSTYANYDIDLVFSGHAHGGQFRIPFIGGVFAPNQDWFPKYTDGVHELNNTKMVISRGLGNSIIPVRINNTPELVITTLYNN